MKIFAGAADPVRLGVGTDGGKILGERTKGPGRRPHPPNQGGTGAAGAADNPDYLLWFIRLMAAS